ncbi:hypothetical protein EV360DRAFT_90028 [Lentinula raphanica]|nr:hypothetical protein EV360DRAFT_90028 [Lentinula raphanica]
MASWKINLAWPIVQEAEGEGKDREGGTSIWWRAEEKGKRQSTALYEARLIDEQDGISHPSHPFSETALALTSVSTTKLKKRTSHFNTHQIIGWPESPSKPHRTVLVATLEYKILLFPQHKVKIGGIGVMSSPMGKSMTDVSLIWVAPIVGDLVYPANLGD